MSHVVAMPVNTQLEITWDRHHVTGCRPSIGSMTCPSAPTSPPMMSLSDLQRPVENCSISGSGISSTAIRETLNSTASDASVDMVDGSWRKSRGSWKNEEGRPTFRLMKAESSTSFDLLIDGSQESIGQPSAYPTTATYRLTSADNMLPETNQCELKSRDTALPNPLFVLPRIELDTQFLSDDVMSTSSRRSAGRLTTGPTTATTTPGIFGLSKDFVVASEFRRQMALQLSYSRNLPPTTRRDYDVIERPPAFNPEYIGTKNGSVLSATSNTSSCNSQKMLSSDCGGRLSMTSLESVSRPSSSVSQPSTANSSHCFNQLPAETKPAFPDARDHYDNEDDDVFYTESGTLDYFPKCTAVIEKTVSTTQANLKSVAMVISRLTSGQQTKTPVSSINRLFRFSVQAAGICRSVSSPLDGGPASIKNRLYPALPQSDLLTSSRTPGRRSLAIRPSRIVVCPVSGDVIIVDKNQSLIQCYTSGGRLESCTEIESVSGVCFLHQHDHRRVAVSCTEPRGVVELYYRAGSILIHEDCAAAIGPTSNVVTYKQGFIAVQAKRLMIYSVQPHVLQLQHTFTEHIPGSTSSLSSQLLGRHRSRLVSKSASFVDIVDCCPMKSGDIVVLDKNRILVLSPDGNLIRSACDPLLKTHPSTGYVQTLAVDFRLGAIVCCPETRRLLQFDPTVSKCPLRRILLDTNAAKEKPNSQTDDMAEIPTCIAVDTTHRRLFVAVSINDTRAEVDAEVKVEVKVYQL